jgi:uncharacterized protein YndB with AHSA1/START domain
VPTIKLNKQGNILKYIKMETTNKTVISVETSVKAQVDKVWKYWTQPAHITKWYNASADWHAPFAENDLRVNGKFKTTMAAKDGSVSFDFEGVYSKIEEYRIIEYTIIDGRKVKITFSNKDGETKVIEKFEAENIHPLDIQKGGWQAILDNFKEYTEVNEE